MQLPGSLHAYVLLQDVPALKFIAKVPRYSDQYTLLISKRQEQDEPNHIFRLLPWVSVLKSCIPGLQARKFTRSRCG